MEKKKLDAIEAAVEERRQARDFLAGRKASVMSAKKQYDEMLASEAAAAARLEKAERTIEAVIKEASNG